MPDTRDQAPRGDHATEELVPRPVRRFLVPGTYDPITRGHLDVIVRPRAA